MADTYKMIAGIVIFVVFISVTLSMAAATFPNLAPAGTNPVTAVPQNSPPVIAVSGNCTRGDWACAIGNFLGNAVNGAASAGSALLGVLGMFAALLTFQIPALQASPLLQLLNFLIVIPIVTVLVLFSFRLVKSIIPTVGGDAD